MSRAMEDSMKIGVIEPEAHAKSACQTARDFDMPLWSRLKFLMQIYI